jgi:hypothetical protein
MPRKRSADPIQAFQRKATAARRVGVDAKCATCGESRPEALIARSKPTICAKCQREQKGHTIMDNHHPAGKANSPVTIPIPVNDHRAILSVSQYDWPKETLENPTSDPHLQMAAEIRGYINDRRYLEEKLLQSAIEKLEAIAEKNKRRSNNKSVND